MPRQTVIFDLGNVLIEWNVEAILDSLGLDAHMRTRVHDELFGHYNWLELDHGSKTEPDVIAEICARSELTSDLIDAALDAARASLHPIPESMQLLRESRDFGLDIYCLSNMSRETYAHIRDRDFFVMFDGVVISGIERCMKPNAEIYRLLLERFAVDPASALFIDDSQPNIDAARQLGIDACRFRRRADCYARLRQLLFD